MRLAVLLAAAIAVAGSALSSAARADRLPVDGLLFDRTEVTVARFRAFASARGLVTAAEREGGGFEYDDGWVRRPGWTVYAPFGAPAAEDEPAVHVTWDEAAALCRHEGGRLPSAAEWERAAYTETRAAPPAPYERGRTYDLPVGGSLPVPRGEGMNLRGADPWPRHARAGETDAGVNGLHEMGGNVWEWAADGAGEERRTMGGSWWYGPEQARRGHVASKPARFHAVYVGFRCVWEP